MHALDFSGLFTLFVASAYDVLLPGHLTPLLIALLISGRGRINIWGLCLGMAVGHTVIMSSAIVLGMFLKISLQSPVFGQFGIILRHVIYALSFFFGIYFAYLAYKEYTHSRSPHHHHPHPHEPRAGHAHPFWLGVLLGLVPCPATAGYAVIGMQLTAFLWMALIAVFAGMLLSLVIIGVSVFYLPAFAERIHKGISGMPLYILAAIVCFAYSMYGFREFKKDFPVTWHHTWAWTNPLRAQEQELRLFYTVSISSNTTADIHVIKNDDTYTVAFSFDYLEKHPPHFLSSLELMSPINEMTQEEYSAFLKKLRDYLEENRGANWQPDKIFMARHISTIHNVAISTHSEADFVVMRNTNDVQLIFNVNAPGKTVEKLRNTLEITSTTTCMSRVEYELFLSRLHACLTLTPLKRK